ncbi:MAG: hypothetical protein IT204_17090 [Fimbriimonadaceae bacterium]|nr:hypothetical protein [Fimbriimonadaceae bacterium]
MADTLTPRERLALTMAHRAVDRPPLDLASTDMTGLEGGPRALAPLLGLPAGDDAAALDEAVLQALEIDFRCVGGVLTPANDLARRVSDTEIVDAWGIGYRHNGHHYEAVGRPLAGATLADLEHYPWPDPDRLDPDLLANLAARAQYLREQTPYVVVGRHPYYGVFELGCWMCGFDDFLYRLAGDPEFVHRFFQIILDYQRRVNTRYYGAVGRWLHLTTSGDDFGMQTRPMLSPTMFRELVIPYFAARVADLRRYTDCWFFHHTCGSVFELIPDLLQAGMQILNPIQPRAANMEPERLKTAFGDRLAFWGGVDTQELLPHGTPAEVAATTATLVDVLGRDGGYILSAAHCILEDVPLQNVVAMYRWREVVGA